MDSTERRNQELRSFSNVGVEKNGNTQLEVQKDKCGGVKG